MKTSHKYRENIYIGPQVKYMKQKISDIIKIFLNIYIFSFYHFALNIFEQQLWSGGFVISRSTEITIDLTHHPTQYFFVPPRYVNTAPHVTTDGISSSPDYIIQTNTLSIPNYTKRVDNDVNINDESRPFVTPRKKTTVPLNQVLKMIFITKYSYNVQIWSL